MNTVKLFTRIHAAPITLFVPRQTYEVFTKSEWLPENRKIKIFKIYKEELSFSSPRTNVTQNTMSKTLKKN